MKRVAPPVLLVFLAGVLLVGCKVPRPPPVPGPIQPPPPGILIQL